MKKIFGLLGVFGFPKNKKVLVMITTAMPGSPFHNRTYQQKIQNYIQDTQTDKEIDIKFIPQNHPAVESIHELLYKSIGQYDRYFLVSDSMYFANGAKHTDWASLASGLQKAFKIQIVHLKQGGFPFNNEKTSRGQDSFTVRRNPFPPFINNPENEPVISLLKQLLNAS